MVLQALVGASTGPRYFERGNLPKVPEQRAIGRNCRGHASTGPRYFERGNLRSAARLSRRSSSFNGAALLERGNSLARRQVAHIARAGLQRGRATSSAESRRIGACDRSVVACFNGAALTSSAEMLTGQSRLHVGPSSFNGAALLRARKWPDNLDGARWLRTRFNGAALLRARKSIARRSDDTTRE